MTSTVTGRRRLSISGYFGATVAAAAANFLMLPLLIRCMGEEHFGRWVLLEPLIVVLAPLGLLGVNLGVVKQIALDRLSPRLVTLQVGHRAIPAVLLAGAVAASIAAILGYGHEVWAPLGVLVCLEALVILLLSVCRGADWVRLYSLGAVVKAVAVLGLAFVAVRTRSGSVGVDVVLWWRLGAVALSFTVLLPSILRRRESACQNAEGAEPRALFNDALGYGFPLLLASILALVIEFADRYVLEATLDYVALAHYAVYLKTAALLEPLLIAPFGLWWSGARFDHLQDLDGGAAFYRSSALLFFGALLLAGGTLWLFSPLLIGWFAPGTPIANSAVLLLVASVVFRGMAAPLNIGLALPGRTTLNIWCVAAAAIAHLLLCVLLIPPFKILGAAWATALSYLLYTIVLHVVSQIVHPIQFDYPRLTAVLLLAFAVCWGVTLLPFASEPPVLRSALFALAFSFLSWMLSGRYSASARQSDDGSSVRLSVETDR